MCERSLVLVLDPVNRKERREKPSTYFLLTVKLLMSTTITRDKLNEEVVLAESHHTDVIQVVKLFKRLSNNFKGGR